MYCAAAEVIDTNNKFFKIASRPSPPAAEPIPYCYYSPAPAGCIPVRVCYPKTQPGAISFTLLAKAGV